MNILIADDEKEAVELIKEWIVRKGYNADVAFDGKQALELIKLNKYDLVFVDHNMPEVTGLELIKYIKQNSPDTKTVMITGYPHIADFAAKELGADEYLTKSFKMREIDNIIDKYKSGDKKNG